MLSTSAKQCENAKYPDEPSQVSSELNALDVMSEELKNLLGDLYSRLQPILNDDKFDPSDPCEPQMTLVPLADRIRHLSGRICDSNRLIRNLLRSCEL